MIILGVKTTGYTMPRCMLLYFFTLLMSDDFGLSLVNIVNCNYTYTLFFLG